MDEVAAVRWRWLRGGVATGKSTRLLTWLAWAAVAGCAVGATDDLTDAWFVGFSPRITVGVWVGRDLKAPIGPGMTGGGAALPIWRRFMAAYLESLPEAERRERFPVPAGVVFAPVDRMTGRSVWLGDAGEVEEAFLEGTEPVAGFSPELRALVDLPWPFQLPSYTPLPGEPMPSPEAIAIADERLR